MSRSTLLRRLKYLNLKRRHAADDTDVDTAVFNEITEHGNTKGEPLNC